MVPEFELFDLGQVHALGRLLDECGLPYGGKVHCRLRHGRPRRDARDGGRAGGRRGRAAARGDVVVGDRDRPLHARRRARGALPRAGTSGSGMEDVLTLAKGVPVEHNEQLVARAVELGRLAQREPMTPFEAGQLLATRSRA